MGKIYDAITPELGAWIAKQHMFFVATAPLAKSGLVNCSPKGMDALRVLGPRQVAYLDLTGSGVETIAHVRENQRITLMLCAFDGLPKIVRLQGVGDVVTPDSREWGELRTQFPTYPGARAIVRVTLTRISDSCGYAVPLYDYREQRNVLVQSAEAKGEENLRAYRNEKNARSLDGLPGLEPKL